MDNQGHFDFVEIEEEQFIEQSKDFFKERVTELRLSKGVSENKMSYELGNSKSYVHSVACGQNLPSMTQFFKLCYYFGIEPEDFFAPNRSNPSMARKTLQLLETLNEDTQKDIYKIIERIAKSEDNRKQGGELNG